MATADAHTSSSGPQTSGEATTECSACAHPWATHDPIAARYCAATVVGQFKRGCVCTATTTAQPLT